ncbi:MAG: hypothetical protein PV340_00825 [Wolbachia sp.]|nr:hypothetical protein [Wolbachia sp.]MDD9336338.1 hypothetical protein [Wolbachia sp.]
MALMVAFVTLIWRKFGEAIKQKIKSFWKSIPRVIRSTMSIITTSVVVAAITTGIALLATQTALFGMLIMLLALTLVAKLAVICLKEVFEAKDEGSAIFCVVLLGGRVVSAL